APTGRFDLVIGDAFGGPSVPWHLTTKEFVEDVHARLAPGGVYTLNVIDYPPLDFVRAEMATIAAVFEHAALVAPAAYVEGRQGGNFVLVGSDSVIDTGTIAAATAVRGTAEVAISGGAVDDFVQDARVLTDDFAPVDQLIGKF
ncbi:MAG: fused MFS/spermidine synthase, partial [Acidimicrobiia bacterium]